MSTAELDWFKISHSSGDNCVEVTTTPDTVHVRDTKDTDAGRLTLSPTVWAAFLSNCG